MVTKAARQRKNHFFTGGAGDPLERAWHGVPPCQCSHGVACCPRRATHRVSAICAAEGCGTAVHVYLLCADCKDSWLETVARTPRAPELRVAPL